MSAEGVVRFGDLDESSVAERLAAGTCLIDHGAARVRVRAVARGFARDLKRVYAHFPCEDATDRFADFHVDLVPSTGLRSWLKPQVRFRIDGMEPFDPFPASDALPLFEWGVNWCVGQRFNQYVLLHAGALALDGRAVLMAAPPGAGKSTLTAALMLSGMRLLSDEFGVLCPDSGGLLAMLKPVALKNASIEVIGQRFADARLGPRFTGTRKGDVAHLAPNAASVAQRAHAAAPTLLVFPRYQPGTRLRLRRVVSDQAFAGLAFNSFNYPVLGGTAFDAVADLVERCTAYRLEYDDLDAAIQTVHDLLAERGTE